MSEVKVFAVGDYDWVAAKSPEEALEWFNKEMSGATIEDVSELTKEQMDTFVFCDDVPQWDEAKQDYIEDSDKRPFSVQLEKMLADGSEFPCHFASTEW